MRVSSLDEFLQNRRQQCDEDGQLSIALPSQTNEDRLLLSSNLYYKLTSASTRSAVERCCLGSNLANANFQGIGSGFNYSRVASCYLRKWGHFGYYQFLGRFYWEWFNWPPRTVFLLSRPVFKILQQTNGYEFWLSKLGKCVGGLGEYVQV